MHSCSIIDSAWPTQYSRDFNFPCFFQCKTRNYESSKSDASDGFRVLGFRGFRVLGFSGVRVIGFEGCRVLGV